MIGIQTHDYHILFLHYCELQNLKWPGNTLTEHIWTVEEARSYYFGSNVIIRLAIPFHRNIAAHPKGQVGDLDNVICCNTYFSTFQSMIFIMMSFHGTALCITGPLCGESTGDQWIPLKKG